MIKAIAHNLAMRRLERAQRRAARELQDIFDIRAALEKQELRVLIRSAALACQHLEQSVTARRIARSHQVPKW